jgi:hypothetical protein
MKRNIYTNRIVRPLENRKVSVFPAMEYCEFCKSYSEGKCKSKHTVPIYFPDGVIDGSVIPEFGGSEHEDLLKSKEYFELWVKEQGIKFESRFNLSSEHSA